MRYRILFLVVVGLFVFGSVYADVPKLINFQGRLTDASGKFVPDGNYSLTFRLYNDSTGGSSKWSEAQLVNVAKGLFNVILGEVTPIPDSIFEYPNAFLGIQVAADPEMTPRQRLSSLGYAYYASNSDKLDGLHASDFTSPVSDFGRSGVAADLYEGSTTMTDKYVNAAGPDSVVASSGTAFLGRAAGSSAVSMYGVAGYTSNASSGGAFGLWGEVASVGTGPWHYAVVGNSYSSSTSTAYTSGVAGFGYASEVGGGYGVLGVGYNTAAGPAFGGYFEAGPDGTGMHYGVRANSYASSAVTTYGSYAYATNASTGNVYGGVFTTSASGTGYHYGVSADAGGNSSSPSYGVDAYASNSSSGNVYGGSFLAASSGTGLHCGTRSIGYGASSSSTYGSYNFADNTSSGDVFAGYFTTSTNGTGWHYGLYTSAAGGSSSPAYGCYSYGANTSSGDVFGGHFAAASSGTGFPYGIEAQAYSSSSSSAYGVSGYASNSSSGDVYAGYFYTSSSGTGDHYGVSAQSYANTNLTSYGVDAFARNMGIGSARAGSFVADSFGTGSRYGVYGQAYGTGNAWTFGSYGWARNSGTGTAFGGYFYASAAAGTGDRYGVFAYGPTYAGYFSGNTVTTGTKSAAVKTDNGEYRLLYSQESPENWFEDFGGGSLQNGGTTIQIDPLFAQTVNTQIEYRVYLTPEGDCRGLYVTNKTANSFEVRELQGGVSNTGFSYRIVAKRKGFENLRLAKIAGQTPEQMEFEQQRIQAESERESARRAKLENPESGPENLQIGEEQRIREENERMTAERLKMEKEREAEKSRMEKERVSMEVSR